MTFSDHLSWKMQWKKNWGDDTNFKEGQKLQQMGEKVGGLFTKGAYQIRVFYRSSPIDDSLVL